MNYFTHLWRNAVIFAICFIITLVLCVLSDVLFGATWPVLILAVFVMAWVDWAKAIKQREEAHGTQSTAESEAPR